MYGLGGNDKISTGFYNTFLSGGAGSDRLAATGTGTLSEYANQGAVQLFGDNGNDTLSTAITLSQVTPEPGEPDTYYFYSVGDRQHGGSGDDELRSQSNISLETGQNATVSASSSLSGDDGNDRLWADSQLSSNGTGYQSTDLYLDGGRGNDSLKAKAVVDSTSTASAYLLLYGLDGADTLNADVLVKSATDGDLTAFLYGDEGADQLTSSFTVDAGGFASGGSYSSGGAGSDSIRAKGAVKAGTEGYLYVSAYGDDGNDAIDVDCRLDSPAGAANAYGSGGNGDDTISVRLTATSASSSSSISFFDDAGNDHLVGTIVGTEGSIYFDGGRGRDELVANNSGNSSLIGGAGSDRMTGGRGADTFGFGGYSSFGEMADGVKDRDVITNYSRLQDDSIDLPNGIDDVDSWKVVGGNTELKLIADRDIIVLQGVVVTDLESDVLFV